MIDFSTLLRVILKGNDVSTTGGNMLKQILCSSMILVIGLNTYLNASVTDLLASPPPQTTRSAISPLYFDELVEYNGYDIQFLQPITEWKCVTDEAGEQNPVYEQLNLVLQDYVQQKIKNDPIYLNYHRGILSKASTQRNVLQIILSILKITSAQTFALVDHETMGKGGGAETFRDGTRDFISAKFTGITTLIQPYLATDLVIDQAALTTIYNAYGALLLTMAFGKRNLFYRNFSSGLSYEEYEKINWSDYLPYKLLIPYYGDCTIIDMTDSMTADVWWLGWVDEEIKFDGVLGHALSFMNHDIGHLEYCLKAFRESLEGTYQEELTRERIIHKEITRQINTIGDLNQRALFHLFHFDFLHEKESLNRKGEIHFIPLYFTTSLRDCLPGHYKQMPDEVLLPILIDLATPFFQLLMANIPRLRQHTPFTESLELVRLFSLKNFKIIFFLLPKEPPKGFFRVVKCIIYYLNHQLHYFKTTQLPDSQKLLLQTMKEQLSAQTLADFITALRQYQEWLQAADDIPKEDLDLDKQIVADFLEVFV